MPSPIAQGDALTTQAKACPRPHQAARLFVRQPLTQTHGAERLRIQSFMDWLSTKPVDLLFGGKAVSEDDFRADFECQTGLVFTPKRFRQYRLETLRERTDGFVFYWGSGLSVSGGFEVGYLYHQMIATKRMVPVFFALAVPIKTTLLQELPGSFYATFDQPEDLNSGFQDFLAEVERHKHQSC